MRRFAAVVAALACAGGLLLASPSQAQDPPVPRCDDVQLPFSFTADSPCVGDSAHFIFSACGNCVDLWGTTWSEATRTLILNATYRPDSCDPTVPCPPETLIAFAGIAEAVGNQFFTLRIHTSVVRDTSLCVSQQSFNVGYVARDCGSPPPGGLCENPPPLPVHLSIVPPCPQPADTVYLQATSPCPACVDLQDIVYEPGRGWVVRSTSGPLDVCDAIRCIAPDIVRVPLGRLASGTHSLVVSLENLVTDSSGVTCLIREQRNITFFVGGACGPPPGDAPVTVDRARIGAPPCDTCPPVSCGGQEIEVLLSGTVRSSCLDFRWLELIPSPLDVVGPPAVRAVFEKSCLESACLPDSTPWIGVTRLPPLPPGRYALQVVPVIRDSCGSDSTVLASSWFPFLVDSCVTPPPPASCLSLTWRGPADGTGCHASVAPGRPAKLTLAMRATEPVAGLQGVVTLSPAGLEVLDVRAVGVAEGMRVAWSRRPEGAAFVLFSDSGRLLPPCDPRPLCPNCCLPASILEVTVGAREGVPFAPVTRAYLADVLGADSLGNAVHWCPSRDHELWVANICADRACDANRDAHTDVRDLVQMVRCLSEPATCADSTRAKQDCEQDGDFDLADVLCCAHVLLRGEMPDSAETVPAPDVFVRFGTPIRTATGVDVPIAIHGGLRLSAARLGLDLPLEHFAVTGLSVERSADDWLALHEVGESTVSLGLIRIAPTPVIPEAPNVVDATLHLAIRPGGRLTGELRLSDGDFTGALGEALIAGESQRSVWLGTTESEGRVALGPPRPNPAAREATLMLTLEGQSEVEMTVHDINGRRVATLHRGRLDAGPHAFTWAGRHEGGGAAPNGLYFVRARVNGRVLTQKLTLLSAR